MTELLDSLSKFSLHFHDAVFQVIGLLLLLSRLSRIRLLATPRTVCSPPGSPVPGILQARVLEWGAIAFSYQPEGLPTV